MWAVLTILYTNLLPPYMYGCYFYSISLCLKKCVYTQNLISFNKILLVLLGPLDLLQTNMAAHLKLMYCQFLFPAVDL